MRPASLIACAVLCLGCGRSSPLDDRVSVVDAPSVDPANPCGGSNPLDGTPGELCGECGQLVCVGLESLRCGDEGPVNACGECDPEPEEECNGYDDDCDDLLDEGCVLRLGTTSTSDIRVRLSSGGDAAVFDATGLGGSRDVVHVSLDRPSEAAILTPHALPLGSSDDPSQERDGAIDGSLATWVRGGPRGVVVIYDLEHNEVLAESDSTILSAAPEVEGEHVVFERGAARGEADLWLFTKDSGFTRLTAFEGRETAPEIAYPFVVYERAPADSPIFDRQIEALNMETGERVALSEGLSGGWHVAPAIDGTRVVWQHSTGSSAPSRAGNIVLYDLATGERRYLTDRDSSFAPRVSGALACWTTGLREPTDDGYLWAEVIEVMDVTTGRFEAVASDARGCDLSGRNLAYLARFASRPAPYYRVLAEDFP